MLVDITMPRLGESVVEGTIVHWLKRVGDEVKEFEVLLEVTTDKVDTEISSAASGTLVELLVDEGSTVQVGAVIARVQVPITVDPAPVQAPKTDPLFQEYQQGSDGPFISPAAERLAAEHDINLKGVFGTGTGGRVTRKDVEAAISARMATPPEPDDEQPATPSLFAEDAAEADNDVLPMTPMRQAIARHMVQSKQTAPHATAVLEVNLRQIVTHRMYHKNTYARDGVNLTLTAYFVHVVALALRAVPAVNATFNDNGIIQHRRCHIGVAVAVVDGLVVPVIRDADTQSLSQIAASVNDLTTRGRNRQLRASDTQGGTFTITNYGTSGSLFATPIINQPQAAILGIGAMEKRPVVITTERVDSIAIQPMCYISLSFDHRLIDGTVAGAFLVKIKNALEQFTVADTYAGEA